MDYRQERIVIVNFKTYPEGTGRRALELSKSLNDVGKETGVFLGVALQATDVSLVCPHVEIPVFAQHVDPQPQGAYTGHVAPEAIRESGGKGTLLNHSENRLGLSVIQETIVRVRNVGLTSVVCANNAKVAAACAALNPEMVAVEPPELIGTGIAVSKARPEIVRDTVSEIRRVNENVVILCGAGITDSKDASSALELGTQGVLISSAVVRAKDPRRVALELARAMSRSL